MSKSFPSRSSAPRRRAGSPTMSVNPPAKRRFPSASTSATLPGLQDTSFRHSSSLGTPQFDSGIFDSASLPSFSNSGSFDGVLGLRNPVSVMSGVAPELAEWRRKKAEEKARMEEQERREEEAFMKDLAERVKASSVQVKTEASEEVRFDSLQSEMAELHRVLSLAFGEMEEARIRRLVRALIGDVRNALPNRLDLTGDGPGKSTFDLNVLDDAGEQGEADSIEGTVEEDPIDGDDIGDAYDSPDELGSGFEGEEEVQVVEAASGRHSTRSKKHLKQEKSGGGKPAIKVDFDMLDEAMNQPDFPWRGGQRPKNVPKSARLMSKPQLDAIDIVINGEVRYEGKKACKKCRRNGGPFEGCIYKVTTRNGKKYWNRVCGNCAYGGKACDFRSG
ncbi:hypothetical protein BJ508DRAFT_314353 [Ascobolus immersus RN42]|uniref:Uncharacterized protein n=1 Tax=Ascobolus immersus RN42 TaxID=1160509 RepID=A0A3N4HIY0_ASCIM|nr:hypothetical protein BJ508DRAFT_314353 [Ascobolus immersus RN42]